jgi:hypothetical protein
LGLKHAQEGGGGRGAPAKVRWPLGEAGARVFMHFQKTSMLRRIEEGKRLKQGGEYEGGVANVNRRMPRGGRYECRAKIEGEG